MRFIYQVPPIFPGCNEEGKHGGYGFSTSIDNEFAILARKTPMNDYSVNLLQKEGREIVKGFNLKGICEKNTPYFFAEGSWLLQHVQVPGDATDLGIDNFSDFTDRWEHYLEFAEKMKNKGESLGIMRYVPHNIDSYPQAVALLALWLNWANIASAILIK